MCSSSLVLLLCSLALLVAGGPVTSVPVTHQNQEVVDVTYISEHLAQYSRVINRYKRAADDVAATTSVIVVVPITVGGSLFSVLFDTGSALLALPVSTCTACDTNLPHAKLSGATSITCSTQGCQKCCTAAQGCPTSQCSFDVTYADNSGIQGGLVQDTVKLGQLQATAIFGGITTESSGFTAPLADGIMGFSQSGGTITCAPSCVPTVMDYFVASNTGVPNAFGLYLDFNGGGQLTLGQSDPTLVQGSFTNISMVGTEFYGINLRSMQVNGVTVYSTFGATILDSGTTEIILPNAAFNALESYFQKNYATLPGMGNPNVFTGQTCLTTLTAVAQYPPLEFVIDGVTVTSPPQGYFLTTTSTKGTTIYCLGISGGADSIGDTILGYTFQRGKYITYDRSHAVISLATGTGSTGSEVSPVAATAASHSGSSTGAGNHASSGSTGLGGFELPTPDPSAQGNQVGGVGSSASALTVSFALILLPFFLAFLAL